MRSIKKWKLTQERMSGTKNWMLCSLNALNLPIVLNVSNAYFNQNLSRLCLVMWFLS